MELRTFWTSGKSPLLDASPTLSDRDACFLRGAASRGGICDDLGFERGAAPLTLCVRQLPVEELPGFELPVRPPERRPQLPRGLHEVLPLR